MANPVVQQHFQEILHEAHPEFAAQLSPEAWAKILAAVEQLIPILIGLFQPISQVPTAAPPLNRS